MHRVSAARRFLETDWRDGVLHFWELNTSPSVLGKEGPFVLHWIPRGGDFILHMYSSYHQIACPRLESVRGDGYPLFVAGRRYPMFLSRLALKAENACTVAEIIVWPGRDFLEVHMA